MEKISKKCLRGLFFSIFFFKLHLLQLFFFFKFNSIFKTNFLKLRWNKILVEQDQLCFLLYLSTTFYPVFTKNWLLKYFSTSFYTTWDRSDVSLFVLLFYTHVGIARSNIEQNIILSILEAYIKEGWKEEGGCWCQLPTFVGLKTWQPQV